MSEITIVTAFFDINREHSGSFSRSEDEYFSYFENWARIQNRVIVFCETKNVKRVIEIREKFGLHDKTEVFAIDNLILLDEDLYISIENAMKNRYFQNFMINNKNPEVVNAKYNFLMCLKPRFVEIAVNQYNLKGSICWLDFGFNHNLKFYPNNEEFNFLWEYEFNQEFIHLFNIADIPNLPIFELIRRMETYIQGGTIIANYDKWSDFWIMIRNCMLTLNNVGLADDDQVLYIMSYNLYRDKFEIHSAYWNEAMKLFGGSHLTYIRNLNSGSKIIERLRKINRYRLTIFNYIRYSFKTFFSLYSGNRNDQ